MLRAVIFDFDGVIADSEVLHLAALNQILSRHSIEITTEDYYKNYLGLTDIDLFKLLNSKGQLELDSRGIENLVEQKKPVFEKLATTKCGIIEGVNDFLLILKQDNIPTAICSGALLAEIELILKGAGLRSFFEVIVSAEQVEKGKPDPAGFLLALQKLNQKSPNPILPDQCVVIEDSHWGLEAAKAARMHTIAITNSYDADQLSAAEKVVDNLGQLGINELQQLCS